jgi:hypothetical protein
MSEVLDARAKAMVAAIEVKSGKSVQDFAALATAAGLGEPSTKPGPVIAWLKLEFELGHGHAMAMAHAIRTALAAQG